MKKLITILICLFTLGVSSQMYVSPNAYVFSNNQFVYVTQEVELNAATSNFYLRNNSQLLQGVNGLGVNRGLGSLSVFQEGTVNNFQYNYWCSPVGVPSAANGNTSFGIARLNRPTTLTASAAATLTSSYDGVSSPLAISTRWIYTFTTSSTYAQWNAIAGASTITPGLGFTMKGTSGTDAVIADAIENVQNNIGSKQRYDFRGLPNDGLILNNVSLNNFTLVGNPYPSAIDLNMFLAGDNPGPDLLWGTVDDPIRNNLNINGTAYYWEQVVKDTHYIAGYEGGYGKYTPAGGYLRADIWSYNADGTQNLDLNPDGGAIDQDGTAFARRFSPIGQGFMVYGTAVGTVSMRNKFRTFVKEGVTSEFARVNNEFYSEIPNTNNTDYTLQIKGHAPQIRINCIVNENQGFIRTALGFADGYSRGFDSAADAQSTNDSAPYTFYHILEGSDKEFAMSFAPFNIDAVYPIGLRNSTQATFKIKAIDVMYGFDPNQMVYIHDKESGIYHNIKTGVFDITLPAGDNKTRFEITFKVSLSGEDFTSDDFQLFAGDNFLYIENGDFFEINSLKIYDVNGKLVLDKNNLGNNNHYRFDLNSFSTGIYIAKVRSGNKNLSLKLIKR
jgi:hypothetical protein